MPDKPATAAGYRSEYLDLVRATCLYVATKLGDLMDEIVIVGGLVPSPRSFPSLSACTQMSSSWALAGILSVTAIHPGASR